MGEHLDISDGGKEKKAINERLAPNQHRAHTLHYAFHSPI